MVERKLLNLEIINFQGVEVRTIFGLKSPNFEIIKLIMSMKQLKVKGYVWCWNESNWG